MSQILKVIRGNLARAPATVRLPGSIPTPAGFHGRVLLDPTRCLACGVCSYACVSDAILGGDEDGAYSWRYDPGRCAFCARCVELCPGRALSMSAAPTPAYTRPGQLAVCERVALPACPDCGALTRPVTAELLRRAFEHASAETPDLARRCERCRRRRLQRSMVAAPHGEEPRQGTVHLPPPPRGRVDPWPHSCGQGRGEPDRVAPQERSRSERVGDEGEEES